MTEEQRLTLLETCAREHSCSVADVRILEEKPLDLRNDPRPYMRKFVYWVRTEYPFQSGPAWADYGLTEFGRWDCWQD